MNKIVMFLITILLFVIVGCDCGCGSDGETCAEEKNIIYDEAVMVGDLDFLVKRFKYLPNNSEVLKAEKYANSVLWISFKKDGVCYTSFNLGYRAGTMTCIPCEKFETTEPENINVSETPMEEPEEMRDENIVYQ